MKNGLEIDKYGTKRWYKDDKYHRKDGPAIIWNAGDKEWYINDQLHREDGPAIEYTDGYKLWYINGTKITEVEFKEWQIKNRKEKIEALNL